MNGMNLWDTDTKPDPKASEYHSYNQEIKKEIKDGKEIREVEETIK